MKRVALMPLVLRRGHSALVQVLINESPELVPSKGALCFWQGFGAGAYLAG